MIMNFARSPAGREGPDGGRVAHAEGTASEENGPQHSLQHYQRPRQGTHPALSGQIFFTVFFLALKKRLEGKEKGKIQ